MEVQLHAPDNEAYVLQFLNADTSEYVRSDNITAGCDAGTFKDAIKSFYKQRFNVDPVVTLSYRTSEGAETTVEAGDVATFVYTI